MRILVTGAGGLVGGRLSEHFINTGHDVVLGARDPSYLKTKISFPASVVRLDMEDFGCIDNVCGGVDLVIHTAGMNSKECEADPTRGKAVYGGGTSHLVQSAIRSGVRRLIYISTSHVYRSPLDGVVSETDRLSNDHPYSTSHRTAEKAVLEASGQGMIDGIVLRMSNGFGAPLYTEVKCWMLLVNELCRQGIEQGCLTLKSSGLQARNFIPIAEICDAIDFLSKLDSRMVDGAMVNVINLGSIRSYTVLEMAKLIQSRFGRVLGHEPELVVSPQGVQQPAKPLDFRIDRLVRLGYKNRDCLIEEIDNLIKYCDRVFRKKEPQ